MKDKYTLPEFETILKKVHYGRVKFSNITGPT